jgi:hypothetical protein
VRIRFSHLLFVVSVSIHAQSTRPEAGPFDASRMNMQPAPSEGVAIRAGRLFDSKSGVLLKDQVILIKGDRITAAGPADRVPIATCI